MPDEDTVWQSILNDRYAVKVTRTGLYRAVLTVSRGDSVVHTEQTGIRYDAIFGPFADEIAEWRAAATKFLDSCRSE